MCFAPFVRVGKGEAISMTYRWLKAEESNHNARQTIVETGLRGWTWRRIGAAFGLGGGLACALSGSVITAATWLTGAAGYGPALHRLGTGLLVLTIPLLIFGAHCLDLIETQKDRARKRRFDTG